MSHTPAPWVVGGLVEHAKSPRSVLVYSTGPDGTILQVVAIVSLRPGETLANAALMAAAPTMLEALRTVSHHADDEAGFMVDVRAAIALAETVTEATA